jgi:protein SCO1
VIVCALLLLALIPIHGLVLAVQPHGTVIVRNDLAPQMLPSEIRRYRLEPHVRLAPGTGVDGYVDTATTPWTLLDAIAAGPFVPGLPNPGRVIPVDFGSALPSARLIDQQGSMLSLSRTFAGKTLLLSFIFSRCPDRNVCPAISSKFAYLQAHLDPRHFALAEISLDPAYDTPNVLAAYGRIYGADPRIWSLLTGEGTTVARLLNAFGIDSMRVSASNFIHSDKLFIVAPDGRVADIIATAQWDPDTVLAQADDVAGYASNPFERFKLSLIADVVAFCGGSQNAGIVILELSVVGVIVALSMAGILAVARLIWGREQ